MEGILIAAINEATLVEYKAVIEYRLMYSVFLFHNDRNMTTFMLKLPHGYLMCYVYTIQPLYFQSK